MLAQPGTIYYRPSLTNSRGAVKCFPGERELTMIKQASRAIEHMTAREKRIQRAKYARRNKMHHIDRLFNDLELLTLPTHRHIPPLLPIPITTCLNKHP